MNTKSSLRLLLIISLFILKTGLVKAEEGTDVLFGVESVDGYSQVFVDYGTGREFLTEGSVNNLQVDMSGEYLVWSRIEAGAGQIVRYHLPSKSEIQITYSGTNIEPKVSLEGGVVWQKWVDEGWQVFYFDGLRVFQLTMGDLSINPDIEAGKVVFARKLPDGEWRSMSYDLATLSIEELEKGPKFKVGEVDVSGEIVYEANSPLKTPVLKEAVDVSPESVVELEPTLEATLEATLEPTDLILPSITPTPTETVTEEDILREINQVPLEELDTPEPSLSPSPTLEPSPNSEIPAPTEPE